MALHDLIERRLVHHVFQSTYEYWGLSNSRGWVPLDKNEVTRDDKYIELRHDMPKGKDGNYGPVIVT